MKKVKLPVLKKCLVKGLLTFTKGVKIGKQSIDFSCFFEPEKVDLDNLEAYKKLFGFNQKLPISYLYLIAQRAQVALMLDKRFTISIPGLIHLSNKIELFTSIDLDKILHIKSSVFVESKVEGSLISVFKVDFFQDEKKVAACESVYLAKRKMKTKKTKRAVPNAIENPAYNRAVSISGKDSQKYASISGDYNPIHISTFIARLFGFKSKIIHGWYLASKCIQLLEERDQAEVSKIEVDFLSAVQLPKRVSFILKNEVAQVVHEQKVFVIVKFGNVKPLI